MRVVVAFGGNALLRRGERPDATIQLAHVRAAAEVLAPLANEHELGICHGNGPQVGLLALGSEADRSISRAYPFDALGAQTQGMIGYWLSQCLRNAGVLGPVPIVVMQVRVDRGRPRLRYAEQVRRLGLHPASSAGAHHLPRVDRGAGRCWLAARRALTRAASRGGAHLLCQARLLEEHTTLICGEGRPRGGGCAGALDRRRSSDRQGSPHVPLLAITLHADRLLIRTDVSSVMLDYGTPTQSALRHADLDELAGMSFPASRCDP